MLFLDLDGFKPSSTTPAATMPGTNCFNRRQSASAARWSGKRMRWPSSVATNSRYRAARHRERRTGPSGSPPTSSRRSPHCSRYAARNCGIGTSIGIAIHPGHGDCRESLPYAADEGDNHQAKGGRQTEPGAWRAPSLSQGRHLNSRGGSDFEVPAQTRRQFEAVDSGAHSDRGKACKAGREADRRAAGRAPDWLAAMRIGTGS